MLLVDKVVMYESNALNKKLTCQMSPLVVSLPSTGFWHKFSLEVWHCGAQCAWPCGLLPWHFGGAVVPVGAHPQAVGHWPGRSGSLLLPKLAPQHSQHSGRF